MPEEKHPPVFAREETRPKNGVRGFLEENLYHLDEVLRVVLEIRIMDYG